MKLGMPIVDTMTVSEVLAGVMKFQGAYIEGALEDSFNTIIASKIVPMCTKKKEETKMPSPVPVPTPSTATKHGLGHNERRLSNGLNTPQGLSRNVSGKESGNDISSPYRSSNGTDQVVTGGGGSTRLSGKNEHGRSLRVTGSDSTTKSAKTSMRMSFDGAEGSSLGVTLGGPARSPIYGDTLRITPTNSDKLQSKRDPLSTSIHNTNPLNTSSKSLPDEAEQLLVDLAALHSDAGLSHEGTGHVLGATKAVSLKGATTDVVDAALLSPAAAGFGLGLSSSNRGVHGVNTRVPLSNDRATDDTVTTSITTPTPTVTNKTFLSLGSTTSTENITDISIPGLLLSKQSTGGSANSSIGSITTRGLESQRGAPSSRNLTKAILGQ